MARKKLAVGKTIEKNIRYRGEFQYAVEIRRKNGDVSSTFATLEEARIHRDKALAELRVGSFESPARLKQTTFADLVDIWISKYPNADAKDRNRLKALQKRPFAKLSLLELRSSHFATFRQERLNGTINPGLKKSAPDTVRNDLAAASCLYNLARKEWDFPSLKNPLTDVEKPTGRARERRILEAEELHLLKALDQGRNPYIKHVVLFAIESAMRQGEIAKLTWDRVDIPARTATLRRMDTKTNKARTVTLTIEAAEILKVMESFRQPNKPVFHCTQNAIELAWDHVISRARKSYLEECRKRGSEPEDAVFNDFHFHDLRHEATSRLVKRLSNPAMVQRVTGHKTLSQLQTYTHLATDDVKSALDNSTPQSTSLRL